MKSLSDYLTSTALTRWNTIKSNPQHEGYTTKQILSNIISRTPATFLLDLSAAQAEISAGNSTQAMVKPESPAPINTADRTKPPYFDPKKYPAGHPMFSRSIEEQWQHYDIMAEYGND